MMIDDVVLAGVKVGGSNPVARSSVLYPSARSQNKNTMAPDAST